MLRVEMLDSSPPPDAWADVARRCPPEHAFFAANWFPAWAEGFLGTASWQAPLRYLVVHDDATTVGVLPLAVQRVNGIRFLALPGHYFPFRGFPISERSRDAVAKRMAGAVTDELGHAGLRIGPVDERDASARTLIDALRQRGWRIVELNSHAQFIVDLPESFDTYCGLLGKSLRKHTAYYERKLAKEHATVISKLTGLAPEQWASVIADIGAIEHRSWLEEKSSDTLQFGLSETRRFWLAFLRSAEASRMLKVWMIRVDGKPVSFCFAIDSGSTRNIIANSYDRAVRDYSTGSILYMKVLEDAFASGIKTVNMGVGDSGYKQRWRARDSAPTRDYLLLRPGMRGALLHAALKLKQRIGAVRK